jgi:hypothetical protein
MATAGTTLPWQTRDADNASVFLNTTPSPSGGGALASRAQVSTGPNSVGDARIAFADVNSDGRPDLASTLQDDSVTVNLNTTAPGAITPSFGAAVAFAAVSSHGVALGDINGDGRPDMAATLDAGSVSVWFNTTAPGAAAPSFSAPQSFATNGLFPTQLAIRDFNGDMRADLVVTNGTGNSVSILRNAGAPGGLTPNFDVKVDIPTCDPGSDMEVADFNGDGRADIAVPCDSEDVLSVLLNTTTPGALTPTFSRLDVPLAPVAVRPTGVATGDLNGDGKIDVAIANLVTAPNGLVILLNTTPAGAGVPTFSSPLVALPSVDDGVLVSIGDINNDGKPDVVLPGRFNQNFVAMLNTTPTGGASLSFTQVTIDFTARSPGDAAIVDLNGDGKQDIAVTLFGDELIDILLNTAFGAVQFSSAGINAGENGTPAQSLQVVRDGSTTAGPFSVTVQSTGGSATSGADYVGLPGVVNFNNGEPGPKPVPLSIQNDPSPEGNESVTLGFANPTAGLGIGSVGASTVVIVDDECTPRPNVTLSVVPGAANTINVNVTRGVGTITRIRGIPAKSNNVVVDINGLLNQPTSFDIVPTGGTITVPLALHRSMLSGHGTLAFIVTDGCGDWETVAGGGAQAWPGGGGGAPGLAAAEQAPANRPPASPGPLVPGAACAEFPTHAAAQAQLRIDPTDPLLLDHNRNGIACEGADGAGIVNPPLDHTPVPRP